MMKVTTAKEMQLIDRRTIDRYGVPGTVLMERAGLGVVKKINELFFAGTDKSDQSSGAKDGTLSPEKQGRPLGKVLVLCGGGNNGGDGYVIARVLHNQGKKVEVYRTVKPASLKGDAKINYNSARKFGVPVRPVQDFLARRLSDSDCGCLIVDALLGTGLDKEVRRPLAEVIGKVNELSCPVISVDIPSGISSDTGQVMGCAVQAHHTVTFGLPKRGHLLYPGAEYAGRLYVEEIGFPRPLLESKKIRINLIQREDVISLLPERPASSHKGTYGHALIVAGSIGKTGAALMAARACLRTGAGLVTLGVPESLVTTFQSRVTEEMILPLPDKGEGRLSFAAADTIIKFLDSKANVLAVGPGLSLDKEIERLLSFLLKESRSPMVIDADGINAVAGSIGLLKKSRAPVILTPHPGEMARLLQKRSVLSSQRSGADSNVNLREEIERDRINAALKFAKRTGSCLVLKGVPTVIAAPDGEAFINVFGNPGMATAGTGDVLTGMITAFLAQGLPPRDASVLGVSLHGALGDSVAAKKGQFSLIASDIIDAIPKVVSNIFRPL